MRKLILFLFIVCMMPVIASAYTGTIEPPRLIPGQFVYTVPEGYNANGIGEPGLQKIQGVAAKLRQPFYIIIVDELPRLSDAQARDARQKGYRETGYELQAAYALDRLAEDWADRYPTIYDISHSNLFLLSFNPRQYRLLAGAEWKVSIGLEKKALEPYAEMFLRRVRGTPKDPVGGIVDMITGVDEHIFQNTDPGVLAAKREAAAKLALMERVKVAQGSLDKQRFKLTELLESNPKYLPGDLAIYKKTLEKANQVRLDGTPEEMLTAAESMAPVVKTLEDFVDKKKGDAALSMLAVIFKILFVLGLIGVTISLIVRRKRRVKNLREQVDAELLKWQQKIKNAAAQYVGTYGERTDIIALDDTEGQTKELYDWVTKELDDIWVAVKALENHFQECTKLASKGSFFRLVPLTKALRKIPEAFQFDTGTINQVELFGKVNQSVTITPLEIEVSLRKRFKEVREKWEMLKKAADFRTQEACKQFPHDTMDEIIHLAGTFGLPETWYKDHPLAGNEDSDKSVWATADALRWSDPLAYESHIKQLWEKEVSVLNRVKTITGYIESVEAAKKEAESHPFTKQDTKVSVSDDPVATMTRAKQAYNVFRVSLLTETNTQVIGDNAVNAIDLFETAVKQSVAIDYAIKEIQRQVNSLEIEQQSVQACLRGVCNEINSDMKEFQDMGEASKGYEVASSQYLKAEKSQEEARSLMTRGRHLEALRKAEETADLYNIVRGTIDQVQDFLRSLHMAKARYLEQTSKMGQLHDTAEKMIREYGQRISLPPFREPERKSGPIDYMATLALMEAQTREWSRAVTKAERAHETEQARIRAEREEERRRERRRREEEDEERRRRSYSSYHSSSSDSSWGGGGSSGFGGGFGGGGSSSCGGGW